MQPNKLIQALISIGLVGMLAACGGGGGGGGTASNPGGGNSTANGTVNMYITDGPSETFNHVWITVTGIAMHTNSNQVWSSSDATWATTMLANPVTIDLAELNNGALNNVFAGLSVPAGSYKQIRFFLLGEQAALSSAAQNTLNGQSSPYGLQWNDQVEYVNSSGALAEAPLEIANPLQGIRLDGTFTVTGNTPLNIATDFDLDKIVVPFKHGAMQAFTMKPNLAYFNLANSGAINGQVDASGICPTNAAGYYTSTPSASCAFNLIVHAEAVSADGTRYEAVRSTSVNPLNGQFTIAPLPLTDANGNALTYDIVVRGRQMQTLMITGVTPGGSYNLTGGTAGLVGGTQLGTSAVPLPVTAVTEYPANLAGPLSPLTTGDVVFEQTPNGSLPHEIRWASTDPYTGIIDRQFLAPWLQAFYVTNDNLSLAAYNASALTFNAATPVEGTGNYNVIANELVYYDFGTPSLLSPVSPYTVTPGMPALASGVVSGTVSGTVDFGTLNANSGGSAVSSVYMVLARNAAIISTTPLTFAANSTTTYSFTGVGAGSSSAELPGAYYYLYVRVNYADGSYKIVPVDNFADLRQSSTATMNATVAV